MLGGAGQARVKRVHVHIDQVLHIAANHHPLEEMDVVEVVDDLGRLIEVLGGRIAVVVGLKVNHVDRGAGGAIVDLVGQKVQVVLGIASEQRDVTRGNRQHVFHQRARKADPAIVAQNRARAGQDFDPRSRGIGEADLFQRIQRALVDALHAGIGQWLVLPAFQAGADRAQVFGERSSAEGLAGGTAARTASGGSSLVVHSVPPIILMPARRYSHRRRGRFRLKPGGAAAPAWS